VVVAAVAVTITAVALTSGGNEEQDATTSLTVRISPGSEELGEPVTIELSCPAADQVQREACARLDASDLTLFEPVRSDRLCTAQFGGPQTATVEGVVDGQEINARFALTDGCEIDRWTSLAQVLEPFEIDLLRIDRSPTEVE